MSIARLRPNFRPHHAERLIFMLDDERTIDRTSERRPTATRIVFIRRDKQRLPRRDVNIDARAKLMVVSVVERSFRRRLLRNIILLGRQPTFQFLIGRFDIHRRTSVLEDLIGHVANGIECRRRDMAISARVLQQILLMILLRSIEVDNRFELNGDRIVITIL